MVKLTMNGKPHNVDAAEDTPLLWTLRDVLNMTGRSSCIDAAMPAGAAFTK